MNYIANFGIREGVTAEVFFSGGRHKRVYLQRVMIFFYTSHNFVIVPCGGLQLVKIIQHF